MTTPVASMARVTVLAMLILGAPPTLFLPGGSGPGLALAAGEEALFDLSRPSGSPFPSDVFTVSDESHLTGLRVDLPKPDCAIRPTDCQDIDVINTLDGSNPQPRLSIPFSGPIDVTSVTSETVFLVSLGSTQPGGSPGGRRVGINQVVWDVATNTLHVETDEFLDQHTRYMLIVTRGVRDQSGDPVEGGSFQRFRHDLNFGQTNDAALKEYRKALLDALALVASTGFVRPPDVIAASVFTTQSVTAVLEKIRDQIKAGTPAPADFLLGPSGTRTVFPMDTVTALTFTRQVKSNPAAAGAFDAPGLFFAGVKFMIPGAIGTVAFGKYSGPNYRLIGRGDFPPIGTRSGTPVVVSARNLFFDLYLPSGPTPPGGWPVAIFGHGFESDKLRSGVLVAAKLAEHGIATIAINVGGHGGGPLGTYTVSRNAAEGGPVTFPAGGRGFDGNGDGLIGPSEGLGTAAPRTIMGFRDGLRQTVVDLMQLVRVIEIGMDVDGDGLPDLDPSRIYYFGLSLGGSFGALLLAVDPAVRAGVLSVPPGDTSTGASRLSFRRSSLRPFLGSRVPSLLNVGGVDFDENLPLRNQAPVTNTVEGVMELQAFFENSEWVRQAESAVAYAPYLRRMPLPGMQPKPVIVQMARGDQDVVNPNTTALLRSGDLGDRTTFFRNDLAYAVDPTLPKDPHIFMARTFVSGNPPSARPVALAAQQQIAVFFASDGALVLDPDDVVPPPATIPVFEVPIVPPLPEDLGFIP